MNTLSPAYAHKCLHQPSCMRVSCTRIFCEAAFTDTSTFKALMRFPAWLALICIPLPKVFQAHQNLTTYPLKTHNCWHPFSLLRFSTITNIHRTYSLQTISITPNYDIFFLSRWHHYAAATSTGQTFNCNGNSKLTQNCPFLFARKLTPAYLVATRQGKQTYPLLLTWSDNVWRLIMQEAVAVCPLAVVVCPNIWETFCKKGKEEEEEKVRGWWTIQWFFAWAAFFFPTKIC